MPEGFSQTAVSNRLLSALSDKDFGLLAPHLELVDLPLRKMLERHQRKVTAIYFLESGFASVVANGTSGQAIEVGLIGREGMTGLAVVLDADRPRHDTFMQAAGSGWCLTAVNLRATIDQSMSLHRSLLRYAHYFQTQTTETALANGRSKIEERLARWILMADDRIDGGELPLTQEFLSVMLGIQRSGVTNAVKALTSGGLIAHRRSKIMILDRAALEKRCNGTYSRPPDSHRGVIKLRLPP
jgi:CRP-like cAMP-binding protein